MQDKAHVREAACVLRAIHATCPLPSQLPGTPVLRLAALGLRLTLPDVIRTKSSKRLAAAGLVPQYASRLLRAFPAKEDADRLDVATHLLLKGLPAKYVREALDIWDSDALARVTADPYGCMFELKGTLDDADAMAAAMSLDDRVVQHAKWLLRSAKKDGHTMLPTAHLVTKLHARAKASDESVSVDDVRMALVRAREANMLAVVGQAHDDDEGLADPETVVAEQRIAAEVKKRVACTHREPLDPGALADTLDVTLTPEQLRAIQAVWASSLSILTGPPGTGKTTVVRAMVSLLGEHTCLLTAPTGRAARGIGGSTVHSASGGRLLTRRPLQETTKADVPQDLELMVVDEASMLTTELMLGVLNLAPSGCHILLVGDPDQLPPVGSGNVLQDLLASGLVPTTRLGHNHRSVTEVQRIAADILAGRVPQGIDLLRATTAEQGMRHVVASVGDGWSARQVLTPHNAQRILLNRALQSCIREVPIRAHGTRVPGIPAGSRGTLRTASDGISTLRFDGKEPLTLAVDQALSITTPCDPALPDDAVMVLKNQNKKRLLPGQVSACNGDVGVLVRATPKAIVRFGSQGGSAPPVSEFPGMDGWLTLAYAATVHKFQGSECERVVLPVYTAYSWDRQLLYTAVTRAKEGVVFVGTRADLAAIVARQRPSRHSVLSKLLR